MTRRNWKQAVSGSCCCSHGRCCTLPSSLGAFIASGLAVYDLQWQVIGPVMPCMMILLVGLGVVISRLNSIYPGWLAVRHWLVVLFTCAEGLQNRKDPDADQTTAPDQPFLLSDKFWNRAQSVLSALVVAQGQQQHLEQQRLQCDVEMGPVGCWSEDVPLLNDRQDQVSALLWMKGSLNGTGCLKYEQI